MMSTSYSFTSQLTLLITLAITTSPAYAGNNTTTRSTTTTTTTIKDKETRPQPLLPWLSQEEQRLYLAIALAEDALKHDSSMLDTHDIHQRNQFTLTLPHITLTKTAVEWLAKNISDASTSSNDANNMLKVLLMADLGNTSSLTTILRVLADELARIRGEQPDPVLNAAFSIFTAQHIQKLITIDPRYRIGLLEALFEVRDFAGLRRAVRGYESHPLHHLLSNYQKLAKQRGELNTQQPPDGVDINTSHSLIPGMYTTHAGAFIWLPQK